MRRSRPELAYYATNKMSILPLMIVLLIHRNSYHKQNWCYVVYVADVDHYLGVIEMRRIGGVVRSNCCENLRLSVVVKVSIHCYVSSNRVNFQIGGTCQGVTANRENKQTTTYT
jgi:hypothetical protein